MRLIKRKKSKKKKESIWDGLFEIVLWIPEILLWPLRALFFLGRKTYHFFISN
ncbi:hypothetical protein P4U90_17780 [Cytobacillus kochii]|uniref:hypothetical protein n=1 Tax=Cytobacillus kochii TaxID=859143 RepID=UPI002E1D0397|nr:hypothetical protein [Cytobacillus kochii]